ncbi:hypothetical protein PDR5_02230 [Pseudomonas sp. DR 5-09]|nr:hypothetical protein PDR5_02230 [Pseudomonas sp. DR 5-09]
MGNTRKTSTTSSSHSLADAIALRKRTGADFPEYEPAHKSFRDMDQTDVEAVRQPDMPDAAVIVSSLPTAEILSGRFGGRTLADYRLKAPATLPAPDALGLRVIKGRTFVDVAPGEIVQVRQTAADGEYRATLMSEWTASGPVLFFDPHSKIWSPERARSSGDAGNVIDIDIDELIRNIRKDSEKHSRVHTGIDDAIEHETAKEATLTARGLKQFPLDQAAMVRTELRVVESVFADAVHAIGMKYDGASAVYESFFGAGHQAVAQQFSDSVARGLALSREYQGTWGEEKFFAVETENNSAAWMYKKDFHGRFFLNRKYMQQEILGMSLGHEMLHTNRIDRFRTIGPNAADFFYLGDSQRGLLSLEPLTVYDIPERSVSEVIMRGGLTVEYVNAFTDDHDNLLFGISDYLGIGDDLDLQTAVSLFNANPALRAHLAANNADSIVYAAKSMQALHRSKTEYAWLDSLIDD